MQTVFSHIVQKRFSKVNEDVATEALAFILHSSDSARNGMMRLLRGIVPDMSDLRFRTQQTEGTIRPDMLGMDKQSQPRVYIENKFWAGLTENQPRTYLEQLADCPQPTILLVIVPYEREQIMWRELSRRLKDASIPAKKWDTTSGIIVHSVKTKIGPILALTSWTRLLSSLELEVADDPSVKSDLLQLRGLCEEADRDAFVPLSSEMISDLRIPAFNLQLNTIVQDSIQLAATEGILKLENFRGSSNYIRIGRYAQFSGRRKVGIWLGIHFTLWKTHGITPYWLVFSRTEFGRADIVWPLLEPWAVKEGVFATFEDDNQLVVAIDLAFGEDKDEVVRKVVDRLKEIANVLK
jgi:hypothetical protein